MITITRYPLPSGKFAYLGDGEINAGELLAGDALLQASRVVYSHASLTPIPHEGATRNVLAFHKSASAASKGNRDLAKYATGPIVVIEIVDGGAL